MRIVIQVNSGLCLEIQSCKCTEMAADGNVHVLSFQCMKKPDSKATETAMGSTC